MPSQDDTPLEALAAGLKQTALRHQTTFETLVGKRSALLEYAALLLAVERYATAGYSVTAHNLVDTDLFRVKKSSGGNPWNFSWYEVSNGTRAYELLTNAKVFGGYAPDGGTYVVDVGVLTVGAVTSAKAAGRKFAGFANRDLRTFIESKALVIYPMLLAQFVGIVLEVKPQFITGTRRPARHHLDGHFDPALVALGTFSANASGIVDYYEDRRYRINVVPRFDTEAAAGTLHACARDLSPALP